MSTIKIKLLKITQLNSKAIYVGKISYFQLKDKVSLTKRIVSGNTEYQRESDMTRVNKIAEFLEKHEKSVSPFPTPLVLALSTEQNVLITTKKENTSNTSISLTEYTQQEEPLPVLINDQGNSDIDESTDDFFELYIPNNTIEKIFIVDGQHRFLGIEKYFLKNKQEKDFEFSVTFLLDYDIYEQAEVFANINFKQKPVNKSLYYDIFGSLPGRNEFTFTHYLVKTINTNPPLDGIVKMLGKGSGIISLAFMVETIIKQILGYKGKIYNLYKEYEELDLLENELKKLNQALQKESDTQKIKVIQDNIQTLEEKIKQTQDYKKLPQILIIYLTYYHDKFPKYFPKKIEHPKYPEPIYSSFHYPYYMFKATGMFGILKIFNELIEEDIISIYSNKETVYTSLDKAMKLIINNQEIFFEDPRLLGAGSASLQKKFYTMLHNAIFESTLP